LATFGSSWIATTCRPLRIFTIWSISSVVYTCLQGGRERERERERERQGERWVRGVVQ